MQAKQILILTEATDITADKVCQWLNRYRAEFLRFNTDIEDVWVQEIEMDGQEVVIKIGHSSGIYNIADFSLIWFRRGTFVNRIRQVTNNLYPQDDLINRQINQHLVQELSALNEFVYMHIPSIVPQINNPAKYNINKLNCLYQAAKHGLRVPRTIVTNNKRRVSKMRVGTPLITKNISDILICHSDQFFMSQSTLPVREKDMERTNEIFFPSLFQEAVRKKADIRVFFFLGHVFPSAVHTHEPESFDFRGTKQMFITPFDLPREQELKLLGLAETLGLESGSADFLLDTDGQLTFLEINPVGQIDFVSYLANLYIEKSIAKILIEHAAIN